MKTVRKYLVAASLISGAVSGAASVQAAEMAGAFTQNTLSFVLLTDVTSFSAMVNSNYTIRGTGGNQSMLGFDIQGFSLTNPTTNVLGTVASGFPTSSSSGQGSNRVQNFSDRWTLSAASLSAGTYNFVVTGTSVPAANPVFSGTYNYTVSPVPEPEAYAMLLAGLALVGFAVLRKEKKVENKPFSFFGANNNRAVLA